jgi:serine/threonine-protein kinase
VTGEGSLLGTPAYMSPEQFEGLVISARADVFSLGAVLYYLMTGEPPYRGPTLAAIRSAHFRPVDPPSLLSPFPIPLDLETVVLRCLERDPSERYASASELDDAFASVEQILPSSLPPPPPASAQKVSAQSDNSQQGPLPEVSTVSSPEDEQ